MSFYLCDLLFAHGLERVCRTNNAWARRSPMGANAPKKMPMTSTQIDFMHANYLSSSFGVVKRGLGKSGRRPGIHAVNVMTALAKGLSEK